jgi:hypothetical protein
VVKKFRTPVSASKLIAARARAEMIFGQHLPKLYDLTENQIVEEYCGMMLSSMPFDLRLRMDHAALIIVAILRGYVGACSLQNFAVKNGRVRFLDWDHPTTGSFFLTAILLLYAASYDAIRILERGSRFKKLEEIYRSKVSSRLLAILESEHTPRRNVNSETS